MPILVHSWLFSSVESIISVSEEEWLCVHYIIFTTVHLKIPNQGWKLLGQQGDQTVNPKRKQPWILIGRTDAESEAPILWSPDVKSQLSGKDPDTGGK